MARIVVPSAEALTTALGNSARESLVTLARSLATQIEMTVDAKERMSLLRMFVTVVRAVDAMDRADVAAARHLARSEAAMDWMARRDEERAMAAAQRAADKLARETGQKPGPASALIDELRQVRERRGKRAAG